ncbi:hypothetical protein SAMN04489712_109184 [Thermomonospora echinospora]|uniref:Uncharacterized protein n=1 Tax=Thermomonospora echinospora TaxID=1992 RepID=A0A1H6CCP5_9ACTN|nr:hypothetical protein [Thermomonospora echinospora]SEG70613.1 hypothetical protein SAMN04489712_109184 [Thermomonospora echinospora]
MTDSPAAKLIAPRPAEPMPKAVDVTLSLSDFVSPSHWVLWALGKICGVNPAEWVGQHVGGDWEPIATVSSALEHVGDFYTAYAGELRRGSTTMLKSWEGNAATACGQYFSDFAGVLKEQEPAIRTVARECRSVAFGAWATSKAVVSALEALCDLAVMIAIEAAASAATGWTVVGPSAGLALIMSQIGAGILLWLDIIGKVGLVVSSVHLLIGVISGLLGAIHGLDAQPFPQGSYGDKAM